MSLFAGISATTRIAPGVKFAAEREHVDFEYRRQILFIFQD